VADSYLGVLLHVGNDVLGGTAEGRPTNAWTPPPPSASAKR
jgi:hypothetical protein